MPCPGPGEVAVAIDKDPRRRVFMSIEGYHYRMFDEFVRDTKYFTPELTITPEALAKYRQSIAEEILPAKDVPRSPYRVQNVQRGYHTYKGKCSNDVGHLVCQKSHVHVREII